ncbi:MAG: hypothetical protein HY695_34745 [Deltaproteobacteria bacterium]|nr:hypothetical protein [Deltaproteobacteria bacterium]
MLDLSKASIRNAKSFLLFQAFFLLLLLFESGCSSYLVVSGGAVNPAKLREIKEALPSVRGLDFKRDVQVEVANKNGMNRHFEKELERDYGDRKLENISLAYTKLGLLPQGVDLKNSLLSFYLSQVAAFYNPDDQKIVVPENLGAGVLLGTVQFFARRDILGEMVLAHELTHALQDQHFSLQSRLRQKGNNDKVIAFRALAEGDATLSGFGYLFGGLSDETLAQVRKAVQDSLRQARSELAAIPEAIAEELLFQYYGGVSFVSHALNSGGWPGINRLYHAPPESTEQVLHPEKYFDKADAPTEINLGDLSFLFQPGWEEIENDVLGELMIGVLFRRFVSEKEAQSASQGWDGDRFVAFRRQNEIFFIWATVWDSLQDAEEFERSYRMIVAQKYPASEESRWAYLERRDRRVVIVEGLEASQVGESIERIWRGMEP